MSVAFSELDLSDEDLERVRRLFEDEKGSTRDWSMFEWLYRSNPAGPALVDAVLDPTESLFGVNALIPHRGRARDREVLYFQSVDTLVSETCQVPGAFLMLGRRGTLRAQKKDADLLIGFPNEESAPGFTGYLRWNVWGDVPKLVKPLTTGAFLRRGFAGKHPVHFPLRHVSLPPGLVLRPLKEFSREHEDLWRRFSSGAEYCVERSADYLNWRIFSRPRSSYRVAEISTSDNTLGVVVISMESPESGTGHVLELIHDPHDVSVGINLLRWASLEFREAGFNSAQAWALPNSPNRVALRRSGYHPIPDRFAQPIPLVVKILSRDLDDQRILDRSKWYVSMLDSDVY